MQVVVIVVFVLGVPVILGWILSGVERAGDDEGEAVAILPDKEEG